MRFNNTDKPTRAGAKSNSLQVRVWTAVKAFGHHIGGGPRGQGLVAG